MTLSHPQDELEILQSTTIRIAKVIADVCEKHDLRYSLIFGSLLGAVRHRGFIPWDGDLDIAMPRPDFELFLHEASRHLGANYQLVNYKLGNSDRYVTRVEDKRLLLKLNSYNKNDILCAWVDVFAVDGLPDSRLKREIHYWRITWRKALCAFAAFDTTVNKHRPNRPVLQQIIIKLCDLTHFGLLLNARKQLEKYDEALKKYPFDQGSDCFCGIGTYSPRRQTWERKAFDKLIPYRFENIKLMGPSDYDSVLRVIYGDYMQLPPESKRTVHPFEIVTRGTETV